MKPTLGARRALPTVQPARGTSVPGQNAERSLTARRLGRGARDHSEFPTSKTRNITNPEPRSSCGAGPSRQRITAGEATGKGLAEGTVRTGRRHSREPGSALASQIPPAYAPLAAPSFRNLHGSTTGMLGDLGAVTLLGDRVATEPPPSANRPAWFNSTRFSRCKADRRAVQNLSDDLSTSARQQRTSELMTLMRKPKGSRNRRKGPLRHRPEVRGVARERKRRPGWNRVAERSSHVLRNYPVGGRVNLPAGAAFPAGAGAA